MTNRVAFTDRVELVETHNILLAINRLRNAGPQDSLRWRRALYHALSMAYISPSTLARIREALELP